jgi:hypothetical protein
MATAGFGYRNRKNAVAVPGPKELVHQVWLNRMQGHGTPDRDSGIERDVGLSAWVAFRNSEGPVERATPSGVSIYSSRTNRNRLGLALSHHDMLCSPACGLFKWRPRQLETPH